ncbi:uncharacterized protein L969DRAFT_96579 [Mixia osmundae IAM 14324]|uniref:CASTOR ACT domain-containing protein n=1 Tax=Mixia osmundae (strain CBS 9802 / IAM 14324 / JCM 22182 / KY 12970) TaxID=764103 RepID=G7EAV2_MIXOS|nr:uncharacterized protein L969DRAFT_96579 [Mixia osmundae IAM 14324]KEI36996.1 hypothetical protein L969DRAFT_96579 [Mixia osmundae IAM 14324]GAA99962.1 hypothetical protein E5Q_06665 [Mixia osmundae IAM 14324]
MDLSRPALEVHVYPDEYSTLQYTDRADRVRALEAWQAVQLVQTQESDDRFLSISHVSEEVSVVAATSLVTEAKGLPPASSTDAWHLIKLRGPFDFQVTGVLSALSRVLAEAHIVIYALATVETDYILVKDGHAAAEALRTAGWSVRYLPKAC